MILLIIMIGLIMIAYYYNEYKSKSSKYKTDTLFTKHLESRGSELFDSIKEKINKLAKKKDD